MKLYCHHKIVHVILNAVIQFPDLVLDRHEIYLYTYAVSGLIHALK